MKIKILLILSLVSANILADEYTGKISIAKTHKFIKLCDSSEESGLYEISSIYHLPKSGSFRAFYHRNYPKYIHVFAGGEITIPSDDIEKDNTYFQRLYEKYYVMPHYMKGLDIADQIYLKVKITLKENALFQDITYCWLPLNLFFEGDGFKSAGEEIVLTQTFTYYKGEQVNSTFKLKLDNTFDNICKHYDEFYEDYQKPCYTQTKNCLGRAIKKFIKKLGY